MGRHRRHRRVSSQVSPPSLSIANAAVFEGDAGTDADHLHRHPHRLLARRGHRRLHGRASAAGRSTPTPPISPPARPSPAWSASPTARPAQTITLNVQGDLDPEGDDDFTVTLSNAIGGTIADGTATGTIVNDDGPPPLVSINDVTVVEGNAGTSLMTFTVTRTGGTGAFDVDYAHRRRQRDRAASDYVATSGTLNFAAGENEPDDHRHRSTATPIPSSARRFRSCSPTPTNDALITDGTGIGTIASDDPIFIHDIQGTSYFSPILAGDGITSFNVASTATVIVRAIVTAVDNVGNRQGYYLTEEITDWDGNTYTSEGIFVMTRNDAGVGTVVSGRQRSAISSRSPPTSWNIRRSARCRAPCWSIRPASR